MKNYKKDVMNMLKKVTLSEPWKNPKNEIVYALMVDGEIVGYLRKKVDTNKLTVGEIHETWRGRKAELMYNNKHVGFVWV